MFDSSTRAAPQQSELAALEEAAEVQLVEVMRAAARTVACAEALGLGAMAELSRRRAATAERDPLVAPVDDEERARFLATELAAALHLSPAVARERLVLAEALATRLPATRDALAGGRISPVHARRVHEAVAALDDVAAATVEEAVVERAAHQTPAQLAASLRRAVLRAEPDGGRERCRQAAAGREVRVRPGEDGLATLSVTGRAELVVAAYERIAAVAAERRHAARRTHHATAPGATTPDATTPGATTPDATAPGAAAPVGLEQVRADVALELLAGSADALTEVAGVSVTLGVVAPATTVLGASDEPGELAGYGPLPAHVVRELAGNAAWQRWWTEPAPGTSGALDAPGDTAPAPGTVTGLGRRRYRPPAALAEAIRARDGQCRFPVCRRRASACDLDHLVAYSAGGDTTASNLLTLCRHHHRLKHRAGWQVSATPAGTAGPVTWRSPTGATTTSTPPRRTEPAQGSSPDRAEPAVAPF